MDAVVEALYANPARTYNMAEIFYLDLWLTSKNATQRERLMTLIRQKRFNFMNAGWWVHQAMPRFIVWDVHPAMPRFMNTGCWVRTHEPRRRARPDAILNHPVPAVFFTLHGCQAEINY